MITGITGILLNEGRRMDFDVITLVAEVRPDIPDARAAAKVIEVIDKIVPTIKIDVKPLYKEAEKIEGFIKKLREQAKRATEPKSAEDVYDIYR